MHVFYVQVNKEIKVHRVTLAGQERLEILVCLEKMEWKEKVGLQEPKENREGMVLMAERVHQERWEIKVYKFNTHCSTYMGTIGSKFLVFCLE